MYQALYRKYRPNKFQEIVGQKAIVKILQNSIETGKISHAYLFYGPRGTGKTSMAKLFAKTINCNDLNSGEACLQCTSCREIIEKECVDIVEIDAASNNGVDEIRELKNKINLVPSSLKYKVYIIDEVHMLSIGAFNALLKTLEEPPNHAVFILATTEVHKVPATVLSRCQCLPFTKIGQNEIVEKLSEVVEKEKISIEHDVLKEIAYSCDGGLRDALSMLDQLSSCSNIKITLDDYQNMRGTLGYGEIEKFFDDFFAENIVKTIKNIQMFDESGRNFLQVVNQFIYYLKDLLINFYLNETSLKFSEMDIIECIFSLEKLQHEMKTSENTKVIFEVGIIEIILRRNKNISREIFLEHQNQASLIETPQNSQDINVKIDEAQEKPAEKANQVKTELKQTLEVDKKKEVDQRLVDIRINNTFAKASKQELMTIKEKLSLLKEFVFDTSIGFLICIILDGVVRAASKENVIISYEYESMLEKAIEHQEELEQQLQKILNINVHLVFVTDERWNQLRNEFMIKRNQKDSYVYIEEPILEETQKKVSEKINNNQQDIYKTAVDIFGDIVEIE